MDGQMRAKEGCRDRQEERMIIMMPEKIITTCMEYILLCGLRMESSNLPEPPQLIDMLRVDTGFQLTASMDRHPWNLGMLLSF